MEISRRNLMKLLLATSIAESLDVEKLLWVPKPIVTVPAMTKYIIIDSMTLGGIHFISDDGIHLSNEVEFNVLYK